jgi:hypothetical protein
MKEEEKKIYDSHQKRLAVVSVDRANYYREYANEVKALTASYGKDAIPQDEWNRLKDNAKEALEDIAKREQKEIVRYMDEIEAYDRRRYPSRISEEPKKEAAAERTPDGVPKSPLYSKFIGDYKPEPSKEPSPPAKGKDEERER